MFKLGIVATSLLVACGGNAHHAAPPVEPAPVADEPVAAPPEEAVAAEPAPPPAPEPAPVVEPPPPPEAVAHLVATANGAAIGVISFEQRGTDVVMTGTFSGLPPGPHGFYIHERGDCTRKARFTGKHLDPTHAHHGPPAASIRHAGDLGNLVVDRAGNATFAMTTDSVLMAAGRPDSILQRSIVVHARKDDRKGDAGAAIACGVIELRDPAGPGVAVTP